MRLSNRRGLEFSQATWEILNRIRLTASLSPKQTADALRLTLKEYRAFEQKRSPLPALSVLAFLDHLDLDIEHFIGGTIDFSALSKRAAGDRAFLPGKYSHAAFSSRRSSMEALSFLEAHFGWRTVHKVLRHFQVTEAAFTDANQPINVNFMTDLCDHLASLGMSDKDLAEMGAQTLAINRDGPMGQTLSRLASPREIYEVQIEQLMPLYDTYYQYRFHRLTNDHAILDMIQNPHAAEALGKKLVGSPRVCANRAGRAAAVASFGGFGRSQVVESHCVHKGDSFCRLHIRFDSTKAGVFPRKRPKRPSFHFHS